LDTVVELLFWRWAAITDTFPFALALS